MNQTRIPCLLMRGGTKKAAYFLASELPEQPVQRDQVLLAALGSPDPRQIDGIGGGTSLTSRVAIVQHSSRDCADVDYLFAQVSLNEPRLDYSRSCGNILAGVGPFAIERGLVAVAGNVTPVRVFMESVQQVAIIHVPTPDGLIRYDGEARIDEVPGTGAPLMVEFEDAVGSTCGALLPTGNALDVIDGVPVTCIDYGVPMVMIRSQDLGLRGDENPEQIDANETLQGRLELIRQIAGERMNLSDLPKACLVAPAQAGGTISTRTFLKKRCHTSISVTSALCVAVACVVKGSVCGSLVSVAEGDEKVLAVEHPAGEFTVVLDVREGRPVRSGLIRTARLLFDGKVSIPTTLWRANKQSDSMLKEISSDPRRAVR